MQLENTSRVSKIQEPVICGKEITCPPKEVVSEFGADGKYIVFQRGKGIRGMKR